MRALKPGREDRLHQRLAGLEVLAGDRHAVACARARAAPGVSTRQVRRAVGVRARRILRHA